MPISHGTKAPIQRISPVRQVDPVVRSLNTIMFGMVVHFGSLRIMTMEGQITTSTNTTTIHAVFGGEQTFCNSNQNQEEVCNLQSWPWWITVLLLHDYWVFLQHSNVLANPYCQRLDRQYGIALLKSNQHWAIAGTLSAYWCRETLGMFLCLPFLSWTTRYMVLYSLIYHTIKSRGVRQDALRRYSPRLGIMRVVIDKFYVHTTPERILTLVRLLLQGSDTLIHYKIISDMMSLFGGPKMLFQVHVLFVVWVIHAALNQFFRCSTASVMVHAWYAMTRQHISIGLTKSPQHDSDDGNDSDTSDESLSSVEEEEDDYVVRRLLQDRRVSDDLKGNQGAASNGVNTAVRIETVVVILALVHLVVFNDVPFLFLAQYTTLEEILQNDLQISIIQCLYAWMLWSILYGVSIVLLPKPRSSRKNIGSGRLQSIFNILDVGMMLLAAASLHSTYSRTIALLIASFVTAKSFMQATRCRRPKLVWVVFSTIELVMKALMGRSLIQSVAKIDVALVGAATSLVWAIWSTWKTSRYEVKEEWNPVSTPADAVFLGHPAELHDCWALWLLPYSLENRWRRPLWAVLLWPLHYAVGHYVCVWRRQLFGDGASFFCCDDIGFSGARMQTWTAAHFGRHFFTHPCQVKCNIEAAARHADEIGVKVLCLGALNKAESINGGGVGVVRALGPHRRISVIHGNHLTAAAVVETTRQCFGEKAPRVFLTGASSKVGWAVARALRERYGYTVLCHSTDKARRAIFEEHGFRAAATLWEGTAFSNLWIVGKYDKAVASYIPEGGTAVVFSVPHPLDCRKDVRVVEAGTLHMDLSRADKSRRFTNKLKEHEIFACHAASVVAAHRLKRDKIARIEEVGPVDPNEMDSWLVDAKALGFSVPRVRPARSETEDTEGPPIVVIGAGPAGLAVAASLRRRGKKCVILEAQVEPDSFGSWEDHFSGLEVTTQKQWCHLPGFSIRDDLVTGEHIGASEYKRYLQLYAARFRLVVKRGMRVEGISRGNEIIPWFVKCSDGTKVSASAVVVATGKHRTPQRNTSENLCAKLAKVDIPFLHSADLRDEVRWGQVADAAKAEKLCVVGFGNSAADVCTAILQRCQRSERGAKIHIATRSVPPVFPRKRGFLRVDTLGFVVRWLPKLLQEPIIALLWKYMPSSAQIDRAFPSHLERWKTINGRVPVIDKYGLVALGFEAGTMIGHGQVLEVTDNKEFFFDDARTNVSGQAPVAIEMVILATGYKKECMITREDRLNGLFCCGFGNDRLLPLKTIGEEAEQIAEELHANNVHQ